ncbi:MarR family winged helix-turn-helix transcriptional regulator [Sandarakinorhabdus oryzae]|uniref:MarR family winged helix-turn-helix transcriptional regulator n=1 Tax=Sandarakinorhabdus oryzae TaxID=2675220 RepID=UPI0018CC606E|nr:MarR family winged helix-turn-helix transcriptional regulator [Sandarakinorhabdus oryzae]
MQENRAMMSSDPIYSELFAEIAQIQALSTTALQRQLPPDLSLAGFGVLNHLARMPGNWGPSRLAAAFQVTKGAMTNTLQKLEAAGHVVIEADPGDARAHFVRITPAGQLVREAALAALVPHFNRLAAAVPRHQVRTALPLLSQVRQWLDNNRPPPHSARHD